MPASVLCGLGDLTGDRQAWRLQYQLAFDHSMESCGSPYHKLFKFVQREMNAESDRDVRHALAHLFDPSFRPSASLCELLACTPQEGALEVQAAIIRAIEDLKPSDAVPAGSRAWQVHQLLHMRFVQGRTLERTAEQLHMSYSSTWRLQRAAIHALALWLWDRGGAEKREPQGQVAVARAEEAQAREVAPEQLDWSSYAKSELASLETHAPAAVANVSEIVASVLDLESSLLNAHQVQVEIGYVQPRLVAALHPSVLRQMLIIAIGRFVRYSRDGKITVFARLEDGNVKITLTGAVDCAGSPAERGDLAADILPLPDVSVEAHLEGEHAFLWILLPSVGQITVLVVDDNPDMLRFYRRSTEGTSYRIVEPADGTALFPTIEEIMPDIIVLDVMLPGADGWELLARLHKDPATRSIPVIVCTVIREEELARSLGAARHLPKPVQASEFIQALDEVRPPVRRGTSKAPTSSAKPG